MLICNCDVNRTTITVCSSFSKVIMIWWSSSSSTTVLIFFFCVYSTYFYCMHLLSGSLLWFFQSVPCAHIYVIKSTSLSPVFYWNGLIINLHSLRISSHAQLATWLNCNNLFPKLFYLYKATSKQVFFWINHTIHWLWVLFFVYLYFLKVLYLKLFSLKNYTSIW